MTKNHPSLLKEKRLAEKKLRDKEASRQVDLMII